MYSMLVVAGLAGGEPCWWWLQRLVNGQMAAGCVESEVTTGANDHQQRMGTGCTWLLKVKGRLRREDREAHSGLGSRCALQP